MPPFPDTTPARHPPRPHSILKSARCTADAEYARSRRLARGSIAVKGVLDVPGASRGHSGPGCRRQVAPARVSGAHAACGSAFMTA